ncbi:hypothetical protein N9B46_02415 [Mariniblastus sp.]|nr:hypothetical protein [Mariniblastus sp.]
MDSEKLIQQLDSNSKSLKQSTLEKLASLGVAAASQANTIAVFASKENDLSLAQNAMSTYLAICPKNARTFQVFLSIAKENRKLYLQIRNSPATFLEDLSKFGVVAEKLLIQISYSGRLAFSINREIAPLSKPDLFTTTHGTKNKIRAMAAGSLAQIPTAPANQAVLEIVKTASIPINQQIDLITISQILNGLAKAARPTITFKDIFNYESRFPREFKKWKNAYEQVKEYNKIHFLEQQFLIRCSKMHNFYDRNGKFLTRGNVEVLEDQRVLVIDADNRRQAFDRSRLSTRDQEWLQSNN